MFRTQYTCNCEQIAVNEITTCVPRYTNCGYILKTFPLICPLKKLLKHICVWFLLCFYLSIFVYLFSTFIYSFLFIYLSILYSFLNLFFLFIVLFIHFLIWSFTESETYNLQAICKLRFLCFLHQKCEMHFYIGEW